MDSQHRHELKDNDLAHLLAGAKDVWNDKNWWARYGNWILLILLVVSGSFFLKSWMERRTATAHEQVWSDLGMASSPESYDAIANNYTDPTIKGLALLRGADLLQQRAASGQQIISSMKPGATTEPEKVTTDPKADAANAILRYQEVLNTQGVSQIIRFNALLGMASAYEDQHDWAKAKEAYQTLQKEAAVADPIIALRAKNQLEILPRLDEPVKFAPETAAVKSQADNGAALDGLKSVPLSPGSAPATQPAVTTESKPASAVPAKP